MLHAISDRDYLGCAIVEHALLYYIFSVFGGYYEFCGVLRLQYVQIHIGTHGYVILLQSRECNAHAAPHVQKFIEVFDAHIHGLFVVVVETDLEEVLICIVVVNEWIVGLLLIDVRVDHF